MEQCGVASGHGPVFFFSFLGRESRGAVDPRRLGLLSGRRGG